MGAVALTCVLLRPLNCPHGVISTVIFASNAQRVRLQADRSNWLSQNSIPSRKLPRSLLLSFLSSMRSSLIAIKLVTRVEARRRSKNQISCFLPILVCLASVIGRRAEMKMTAIKTAYVTNFSSLRSKYDFGAVRKRCVADSLEAARSRASQSKHIRLTH